MLVTAVARNRSGQLCCTSGSAWSAQGAYRAFRGEGDCLIQSTTQSFLVLGKSYIITLGEFPRLSLAVADNLLSAIQAGRNAESVIKEYRDTYSKRNTAERIRFDFSLDAWQKLD